MSFSDYSSLANLLISLGAKRAVYKRLSENDNSKQQIYLGSDFTFLTELPFGEITSYSDVKLPNFKAPVDLWWINENGETAPAPDAQLILYPKYPEVRLSGFMRGCITAPSGYMSPIPAEERGEKNAKDGRVLILGITEEGRIYAYLAIKDSTVARSIPIEGFPDGNAGGTLLRFPLSTEAYNSREQLLAKLSEICRKGWIESCRMNNKGSIIKYNAKNGGGYTLEALFGIIPNGRAEPDFMGWELKAFKGNRITLMTPEPDAGFYQEFGAKEFVLKYGHDKPDATKYFTGTHMAGIRNKTSSMIMEIRGFDAIKGTITDVSGGIFLIPPDGSEAAIWSFPLLLKHWSHKHAHACYVRYDSEIRESKTGFTYKNPIWLGEGTDFSLFLKAMSIGNVVYDPGTKVSLSETGKTKIKARSQFRINFNKLGSLYQRFEMQKI